MSKVVGLEKFKAGDEVYLSQRKKVAKDIGFANLFEWIDQFGLYAGVQSIAKALAVYELIKLTRNIPGDIIEFGCWKGGNLMLMAKILQVIQPNTIKQVYGFDSFEGLQTFSKEDNIDKKAMKGQYRGNEDILKQFIKLYEMDGWIHLVKGDANKTIKEFARLHKHMLVSLAYLDFDLYTPTVEALNFLSERIPVGGLIVFDEALYPQWEGESQAMFEFRREFQGQYEEHCVSFTRQPTVILKRVC